MLNIREATLEDLETIHAIETLSFGQGSYPLFVMRQLFDISKEYFLVAEEGTTILGYALGNHTKFNDQGWILSLGIRPESRGQEVGAQLTQKLVDLLENSQSREICLTVHPDNLSGIRLYKKLGFEIAAEYDNYYLDNEARLLMTKKTAMGRINS